MTAIKDYLLPLERTEVDTNTLGPGSYSLIKIFAHPISILRISNSSDENVDISFDGVTDHDIVFVNDVFVINSAANNQAPNYRCLFRKNTHLYLKSTAGTGFIYISGYYQPV